VTRRRAAPPHVVVRDGEVRPVAALEVWAARYVALVVEAEGLHLESEDG
jgi:hypothetical protein